MNVVINFDFPKNSETYLHRVSLRDAHECWPVNDGRAVLITPISRLAIAGA